MFFALVGVLVALNVTQQVNCQVGDIACFEYEYMRVYSPIFRLYTRSTRSDSFDICCLLSRQLYLRSLQAIQQLVLHPLSSCSELSPSGTARG